MTLEKTYSDEVELTGNVSRVIRYLDESSVIYANRFVKGHIRRNPDETVVEGLLKTFSDYKAIKFLSEHVLELYGSSEKRSAYLPSGDVVLDEMQKRVRSHIGRIAAVLIDKDPDDFWIPTVDFDKPDIYLPYARGSSGGEKLAIESVFLPGKKYDTGISCQYDFSRSFPTDVVPMVAISGVNYYRRSDAA
jgi:hypothetical protein